MACVRGFVRSKGFALSAVAESRWKPPSSLRFSPFFWESDEKGQHLVPGDDQGIQDLTEVPPTTLAGSRLQQKGFAAALKGDGDGRDKALDDDVVHKIHVGLRRGHARSQKNSQVLGAFQVWADLEIFKDSLESFT